VIPLLSPDRSIDMSLAVYTTIYPGVEPYLSDWFCSLRKQTDREFELWIGLDGLTSDSVQQLLGTELDATWVVAAAGATPAEIRDQALTRIAAKCSGVVLVDSDDRMHPTRVEAAKTSLERSELTGCALRIIDERGESLGRDFSLPVHAAPDEVFPRHNVFGFSNSAIRSELLRQCLPLPGDAVLVDWVLATRAWLLGARLSFDPVPRMDYRQYSANTARLQYPIHVDQIVSDTALVQQHFRVMLNTLRPEYLRERVRELRSAAAEVEAFRQRIVLDSVRLKSYVEALNVQPPATVWWSAVAYQPLEDMWKSRS
jgi:hypothetical protein